MKLAEKFNKIYDYEWTDIIERLEKKGPNTEEHKDKCVYHLYSVLIVSIWYFLYYSVRVMKFNATFNNISAIMWRSVLLEEETRLPGENQRPATRH